MASASWAACSTWCVAERKAGRHADVALAVRVSFRLKLGSQRNARAVYQACASSNKSGINKDAKITCSPKASPA